MYETRVWGPCYCKASCSRLCSSQPEKVTVGLDQFVILAQHLLERLGVSTAWGAGARAAVSEGRCSPR